MRVLRDAAALGTALPGGYLSIGNFDGLHVGHRHVLGTLLERARAASRNGPAAPAIALTFDPHPAALLSSRGAPARLSSPAQQEELLAACGLDGLLRQPFDAAFADVSAEAFLEDWLLQRLRVRGVVVGTGFRFGRSRAGDVHSLREAARGRLDVVAVDPLRVEGEPASSSRARHFIATGAVEAAARLLGRPHAVEGRVVEGARRGRTIGFPTANVDSGDQALPLIGVYASVLRVGDRRLAAVSNVGVRPTFESEGRTVLHEVHALEDPGDLYGSVVRVAFLARLRGEQRFDGIEALAEQIRRDITAAAAAHAQSPPHSLAGPGF